MDCNLRMFLENRLGWTRLVNNVDVLNMMVLIYDYTIPSFNCEQKIIYIYPCIVNSVEEIKRVFLSKRVCFNFIRRKKLHFQRLGAGEKPLTPVARTACLSHYLSNKRTVYGRRNVPMLTTSKWLLLIRISNSPAAQHAHGRRE